MSSVGPAVHPHRILDRDPAEQPTAAAARTNAFVIGALGFPEIPPHHQLARGGTPPVLGDGDEARRVRNGERVELWIHEDVPHRAVTVEAAIGPAGDPRPRGAVARELEIRGDVDLADIVHACATVDELAGDGVSAEQLDPRDLDGHREPVAGLGVHHPPSHELSRTIEQGAGRGQRGDEPVDAVVTDGTERGDALIGRTVEHPAIAVHLLGTMGRGARIRERCERRAGRRRIGLGEPDRRARVAR